MLIVAKSKLDKNHLRAKIQEGTKDIEIQLLDDFYNLDLDINTYAKEAFSTDAIIRNVHTPLMKGVDFNLDFFTHPDYQKIFDNICQLSQLFGNYYQHPITVVVHNTLTIDSLLKNPLLQQSLTQLFKLEVIEDDYLNCRNFRETKTAILPFLKNK